MIDPETIVRAQADVIARNKAIFMPDKSCVECSPQLPLPGVVILVHGVNSDGEWYEATEQGLCAGLNTRLARNPEQMSIQGVAGGQLTPAVYTRELDDGGFLDDRRNANTFIDAATENYSPVIRFRWGYKADKDALAQVGKGIWLNEKNYWGGGPFANGCTSLADLWTDGINDRLFLWYHAQDMNPEPGRDVYTCPPRHYYALAAKRLAELIRLVRSKQADVPITVVCHSQGNMIGLAAAFYGDELDAKHGPAQDAKGRTGPSVADTYVLTNPPYSLVDSKNMLADNISQSKTHNEQGESGRVTRDARIETLKNFCRLIGKRLDQDQPADKIDMWAANAAPQDGSAGYTAAADKRAEYAGKGRVTLYCNPHDRVISSLTIRGIGWQGVSADELGRIDASKKVFYQRVWAQGHPVGQGGTYRYWRSGAGEFWHPPSRAAKYNIKQAIGDSEKSFISRLFALLTAPISWLVVQIANTRINAVPEKNWEIPVNAALPKEHLPQAQRLGKPTAFDQDLDPDSNVRNAKKALGEKHAGDPYDNYAAMEGEGPAQGDSASEAQLRYEHRARLRMQANREGKDGSQAQQRDTAPSAEWSTWSNERIATFLAESVNQHATDHSTIMTCAANSEHVLAYDVAAGMSRIGDADWLELRIAADWQLGGELKKDNPLAKYSYYFDKGLWTGYVPLHEHPEFAPSARPPGIDDRRTNRPANSVNPAMGAHA